MDVVVDQVLEVLMSMRSFERVGVETSHPEPENSDSQQLQEKDLLHLEYNIFKCTMRVSEAGKQYSSQKSYLDMKRRNE